MEEESNYPETDLQRPMLNGVNWNKTEDDLRMRQGTRKLLLGPWYLSCPQNGHCPNIC